MKPLRYIKKWVWIVAVALILFGCMFFTVIGGESTSGRILAVVFALVFIGAGASVFMFAYNRSRNALDEQDRAAAAVLRQDEIERERVRQRTADWIAERNEYQYTFEGAQTVANHTVIDYAPTDYNAQVMLYGLSVGDEIPVFREYDGKYEYTMGDDIPLPPRLVNIYTRKRICRLYVYKIDDTNPDRRAIQILVAYNPE